MEATTLSAREAWAEAQHHFVGQWGWAQGYQFQDWVFVVKHHAVVSCLRASWWHQALAAAAQEEAGPTVDAL